MITKLTTKQKKELEFNNGFVTAIALFTQHKHQFRELREIHRSDLRLYAATDHLYDIELPEHLPKKLAMKIGKARAKAFNNRMDNTKDWKVADNIFKEFEDILKAIDEHYFVKKEVVLKHR